ncbi:MAG TPA: hypothetical protein VKZ91_04920, partial [Woeseiaceae bacterium]|nr:hypothetical protein [Woeseiaceae bacterium]
GCSVLNAPSFPKAERCVETSLHAVSRVPLLFSSLWRTHSEIRQCDGISHAGKNQVVRKYDAEMGELILAADERLANAWLDGENAAKTFLGLFDSLATRLKADAGYRLQVIAIPEGHSLTRTRYQLGRAPSLTFYFPYTSSTDPEARVLDAIRILASAGHELFHALAGEQGDAYADPSNEEEAAYLFEMCLLGRMAQIESVELNYVYQIDTEAQGETRPEIAASSSGRTAAIHRIKNAEAGNISLSNASTNQRLCKLAMSTLAGEESSPR